MEQIKQDFRCFAIVAHHDQTYDSHPYAFHLAQVECILVEFGFDGDDWRAAAWLHDVLEDTETQKDVVQQLYGPDVANIVFAVSGFGANRKIRNQCIHDKIEAYPPAAILKLADRIANVEHGKRNASKHFDMYRQELPVFRELIQPKVPKDMWERLESLFH